MRDTRSSSEKHIPSPLRRASSVGLGTLFKVRGSTRIQNISQKPVYNYDEYEKSLTDKIYQDEVYDPTLRRSKRIRTSEESIDSTRSNICNYDEDPNRVSTRTTRSRNKDASPEIIDRSNHTTNYKNKNKHVNRDTEVDENSDDEDSNDDNSDNDDNDQETNVSNDDDDDDENDTDHRSDIPSINKRNLTSTNYSLRTRHLSTESITTKEHTQNTDDININNSSGRQLRSRSKPENRNQRTAQYTQSRLHFNSKLPNWNKKTTKKRSIHKNKSYLESRQKYRRHYDSSSESSDDSDHERNNRYSTHHSTTFNRSQYNANKFSTTPSMEKRGSWNHSRSTYPTSSSSNNNHIGDDDHHFYDYEEQRIQRELDSIQPINTLLLNSNNSNNSNSNNSSNGGNNNVQNNMDNNNSNTIANDTSNHASISSSHIHSHYNSTTSININTNSNSNSMGMGGSVIDKISDKDLLRADVLPIAINTDIGFNTIGGLETHIQALKEMIILPLLYPELFAKYNTDPPRGVLFLGPPGTGKTLTARALASSVSIPSYQSHTTNNNTFGIANDVTSTTTRKISFFMRKGADCLSKWVGEGERQLRLLFEQAKKHQPSIIFFDEIDGLAPVRSVKQDQIHASIVSTLLALMDGLDSRGQVIVIGATNRPDAIDPALRRPGRFDRELLFPLPNTEGRSAIVNIHTGKWNPPLSQDIKSWIVSNTVGYCGADIKALCTEATLIALQRAYPHVYSCSHKLQLDPSKLHIRLGDFAAALNKVIPCSQRSGIVVARPLHISIKPLLDISFQTICRSIKTIFHTTKSRATSYPSTSCTTDTCSSHKYDDILCIKDSCEEWIAALMDTDISPIDSTSVNNTVNNVTYDNSNNTTTSHFGQIISNSHYTSMKNNNGTSSSSSSSSSSTHISPSTLSKQQYNSLLWGNTYMSYNPKFMIVGNNGMGQEDLALALLHTLESYPCFTLDHATLMSDMSYHSPEQAFICKVQEAYRLAPAVIYIPNILHWWNTSSESMKRTLYTYTESTKVHIPVLWLTTVSINDTDIYANSCHQIIHSTNTSEDTVPHIDPLHDTSDHTERNQLNKVILWLSNNEYDLPTLYSACQQNSSSTKQSAPTFSTSNGHSYSGRSRPLYSNTSTYISSSSSGNTTHNVSSSSVYIIPIPIESERYQYFHDYFNTLYTLPHKIYNAKLSIYESRLQLIQPKEIQVTSSSTLSNSDMTNVNTHTNGQSISPYNLRNAGTRTTNTVANTLTPTRTIYLSDEDKQCRRELRTFFRAAITEIMKEKKYNAFSRPVDPDTILDYYDVITCPMDLETIRMKIDDDIYPTLLHFMRDIQQIVFNAQEYNPMTRTDQRGRNIIHTAHGMIDILESHAYYYKEELGYDVFKQCDKIAHRERIVPPRGPPRADDTLPEENKKYYQPILEEHEALKKEREDLEESEEHDGQSQNGLSPVSDKRYRLSPRKRGSNSKKIDSLRRSHRNVTDTSTTTMNSGNHDDERRKQKTSPNSVYTDIVDTNMTIDSNQHVDEEDEGMNEYTTQSRHSSPQNSNIKRSRESEESKRSDSDFYKMMDDVLKASSRKVSSHTKKKKVVDTSTSIITDIHSSTYINTSLNVNKEVTNLSLSSSTGDNTHILASHNTVTGNNDNHHHTVDLDDNSTPMNDIIDTNTTIDTVNHTSMEHMNGEGTISSGSSNNSDSTHHMITIEDIKKLPHMIALQQSITLVEQDNMIHTRINTCIHQCTSMSSTWKIEQFTAFLSKINSIVRRFTDHGNISITIQEIEELIALT